MSARFVSDVSYHYFYYTTILSLLPIYIFSADFDCHVYQRNVHRTYILRMCGMESDTAIVGPNVGGEEHEMDFSHSISLERLHERKSIFAHNSCILSQNCLFVSDVP